MAVPSAEETVSYVMEVGPATGTLLIAPHRAARRSRSCPTPAPLAPTPRGSPGWPAASPAPWGEVCDDDAVHRAGRLLRPDPAGSDGRRVLARAGGRRRRC